MLYTSLGIPYPESDATVSAAAVQSMMEKIETLIASVSGEANATWRGPGASIFSTLSLPIASTTTQTFAFDVELSDTAGIADLATNASRLTLTSGVWLVGGEARISSSVTAGSAALAIESQLQGTVCADSAGPADAVTSFDMSTLGMLATTGEYITMTGYWIGSAGATGGSATMWAYRLRDY